MTVLTSPAYSPWSNGTCERHNGIIADMFYKLLDEQPGTSHESALEHATYAKNSLESRNGFSPFQLVYGSNPRIPGVSSSKPPALSRQNVPLALSDQQRLLERF